MLMPQSTDKASNIAVKVDNVYKTYISGDVEVKAVMGISFTVKRGEFAAIVGPSGSGKSTLMNLMGTVDRPTSGSIYIDGEDISKLNDEQLAVFRNKHMGFIFQAFNLINGLTAQQNVFLPLLANATEVPEKERYQKAAELLSSLGLGERLHLPPSKLSGGEQQRVAIARALVNDPSLILADEPTGDLDTKSGENVVKLLSKVSKERNVTIIMITHNLEITSYCDKIIYVRDGKLEKEKVVR
jgi:putative ABC transport system ATP-binding protein